MKKALKFLSLGMAIAMCLTMTPTAVFAATTTQDVTTDGSYGVNVSVINASTYTVTIPKTLSVTDTDIIYYDVNVTGDIAGTEKVVVTPDANVVLSSYNKDDVIATITQDQTEWGYDEWALSASGEIDVSGCTAGEWNGSFNFNISLAEVVYVPFTVTADNRSKIGYTDETTNLGIPTTFQDTDGTWYKVTSIGEAAFYNCDNLESVTIGNSVTSIGTEAFIACTNLTSVTIGNSVETIGQCAFTHCASLTSITIPDSVTYIYDSALESCESLTSVTIPDSVIYIGDNALDSCEYLTNITYNGTMEQWNAITKEETWNQYTGNYTIHCTDGDIAKS